MGEMHILNLASDEALIKCIQKKELELDNPLSEAEIKRHLERLDSIMIPTIKRIEIEKNHDPYKHGLELIERAERTAKILGCSNGEVSLIGLAAYLHDIGKRAVYDSIVNKPSQLTHDEYKQIQNHVVFGQTIVKPFKYIGHLVKYHHERYDGKGYMEGLKGNNIPLGARIIAVVDAYDAMTHLRIYDPKQPKEFAVNEIERCARIQFDKRYIENFRINFLKQLSNNCAEKEYKNKLMEILCKKGEFNYNEEKKKSIKEIERDYIYTRLRPEEQFDKAVVAAFLTLLGIKNKRQIPSIRRFGYLEIGRS